MGEPGQHDPSASPDHVPDETKSRTFDSNPGTEYVRPSSQTTIPPRPAAASRALPERFGRYRVVRCLGEGAMGAVYLADDTQLDRPVAIKIPKFTQDGNEELIERFFREAKAAATLRHPNVCPVHDVGVIDGVHYLSMAFLEGEPLADLLAKKTPISQSDAAVIVLKLAKALDAAHTRGVIHRDLKPANIMIDTHGEPIIMDFGLARRLNKDDSRLTQDGLVMGSPAYMSPEQVEGDPEKMGAPCDIYSLGVIFYELLTGQVPFQGSVASVMGQIITAAPKKPSSIKSGIDPTLEAICLKMIAKRPEDRFASMREVVAALEARSAGRTVDIRIPEATSIDSHSRPERGRGHHTHGILIAPWMLWTAIAVVIVGFGVTWRLFAVVLQQQNGPEAISLNSAERDKVRTGALTVAINGKKLEADQLKQPFKLGVGSNNVQVRDGDVVRSEKIFDVPADDDQANYLELSKNGLVLKRHPRIVAEMVFLNGGKIKLKGSDTQFDNAEALPNDKLDIEEIDLGGVTGISPHQWESIKQLHSLKRLVLYATGIKRSDVEALHKALPDCKIES